MKKIIKTSILIISAFFCVKASAAKVTISKYNFTFPKLTREQRIQALFACSQELQKVFIVYRIDDCQFALIDIIQPGNSIFISADVAIQSFHFGTRLEILELHLAGSQYFMYGFNTKTELYDDKQMLSSYYQCFNVSFAGDQRGTLLAGRLGAKSVLLLSSKLPFECPQIKNFTKNVTDVFFPAPNCFVIQFSDGSIKSEMFSVPSAKLGVPQAIKPCATSKAGAGTVCEASEQPRKTLISKTISKNGAYYTKFFNDATLSLFSRNDEKVNDLRNIVYHTFISSKKGCYLLLLMKNGFYSLYELFEENLQHPHFRVVTNKFDVPKDRYVVLKFNDSTIRLFDLEKKQEIDIGDLETKKYRNFGFCQDSSGRVRYCLLESREGDSFVVDLAYQKVSHVSKRIDFDHYYLYNLNGYSNYSFKDLLLFDVQAKKSIKLQEKGFNQKNISGVHIVDEHFILFAFEDGSRLMFDCSTKMFLDPDGFKVGPFTKKIALKNGVLKICDALGRNILHISQGPIVDFKFFAGRTPDSEYCLYHLKDGRTFAFDCSAFKTNRIIACAFSNTIRIAPERRTFYDFHYSNYCAILHEDASAELLDYRLGRNIELDPSSDNGTLKNVEFINFFTEGPVVYFVAKRKNGSIFCKNTRSGAVLAVKNYHMKRTEKYAALHMADNSLLLLDTQKGIVLSRLPYVYQLYKLVCSQNRAYLFFGDKPGNLRVFDCRKNEQLFTFAHCSQFQNDASLQYLVVNFKRKNAIEVFDLDSKEKIVDVQHNKPLTFTFDYDYNSRVIRLFSQNETLENAEIVKKFSHVPLAQRVFDDVERPMPIEDGGSLLVFGSEPVFVDQSFDRMLRSLEPVRKTRPAQEDSALIVNYMFHDSLCYRCEHDPQNRSTVLLKFGDRHYVPTAARITRDKRERADSSSGSEAPPKKRRKL